MLLLETTGAILPFLSMTILAIKRSISIWLEWQFSNGGAALGTGPITFIHLPVARKILVIHSFLFTKVC